MSQRHPNNEHTRTCASHYDGYKYGGNHRQSSEPLDVDSMEDCKSTDEMLSQAKKSDHSHINYPSVSGGDGNGASHNHHSTKTQSLMNHDHYQLDDPMDESDRLSSLPPPDHYTDAINDNDALSRDLSDTCSSLQNLSLDPRTTGMIDGDDRSENDDMIASPGSGQQNLLGINTKSRHSLDVTTDLPHDNTIHKRYSGDGTNQSMDKSTPTYKHKRTATSPQIIPQRHHQSHIDKSSPASTSNVHTLQNTSYNDIDSIQREDQGGKPQQSDYEYDYPMHSHHPHPHHNQHHQQQRHDGTYHTDGNIDNRKHKHALDVNKTLPYQSSKQSQQRQEILQTHRHSDPVLNNRSNPNTITQGVGEFGQSMTHYLPMNSKDIVKTHQQQPQQQHQHYTAHQSLEDSQQQHVNHRSISANLPNNLTDHVTHIPNRSIGNMTSGHPHHVGTQQDTNLNPHHHHHHNHHDSNMIRHQSQQVPQSYPQAGENLQHTLPHPYHSIPTHQQPRQQPTHAQYHPNHHHHHSELQTYHGSNNRAAISDSTQQRQQQHGDNQKQLGYPQEQQHQHQYHQQQHHQQQSHGTLPPQAGIGPGVGSATAAAASSVPTSSGQTKGSRPPRQRFERGRIHAFKVNGSRFVIDARYMPIKPLGRGAYGIVCSATDLDYDIKVAIKRIPSAFKDIVDARRILRETQLLRSFNHPHIIGLCDIIDPGQGQLNDVYMVMELMETDLHKIIYSSNQLTDEHIQYLIYQTLRGLHYIHSHGVIHRDLKPSNLLLNQDCSLKICDFGLARIIGEQSDNNELTEYVVTRWYRAPEVMYSLQDYDYAIDVWAVGCILAELLNRRPLFPGDDYIHQLHLMFSILGTPKSDDLSAITNTRALAYIQSLPHQEPVDFAAHFPTASPLALDLLKSMLTLHPKKRITVKKALNHPFFKTIHEQYPPLEETNEIISLRAIDQCTSTEELRQLMLEMVKFYRPWCTPHGNQ